MEEGPEARAVVLEAIAKVKAAPPSLRDDAVWLGVPARVESALKSPRAARQLQSAWRGLLGRRTAKALHALQEAAEDYLVHPKTEKYLSRLTGCGCATPFPCPLLIQLVIIVS